MNVKEAVNRELQRLQIHSAYKRVFGTADGELVLRHMAKKFGGDTFVQGSPDLTLINQGQRRVVLTIFRFINRDPSELIKLESEQL